MRKWLAVILLVLLLLPACALAAELKITEQSSSVKVTPTMYGYELKDGKKYVIEGSSNGGIMLDIEGNVTITLNGVNLKDSLEISSRAFGEKKVSLVLTGNNYISSHDQPAILVMADKCDLTIQTASTNPPHSLKLKSDYRAGIQNTNGKVSLDSGFIDIQAGSDIPYAIIASSIECTPYRAYPKVRHWIGYPWRDYDTEMDRILTTRHVATYNVLQNRYAGSTHESNVTPGTKIQLIAGGRTGYKFVRWESNQKTQIDAANVDNEDFAWNDDNAFLVVPACDIVLSAVWKQDGEEETEKEYGNLTVKVTPDGAGAGYVVGTIGDDSPFVADGTEAYPLGTSVRLEAYALSQYEFANWSTEGDVVISKNPVYMEEVNGDRTLYANFRKKPYVEEVHVTKKVDGDLDSSVTGAKPIEYVYVWGDDYSVWGSKVTSPGYTAVDVVSHDGSRTESVTVTVSGEATWYVLGEVLESGKVAGYTCEAKAVSVDIEPAFDHGAPPAGLGDGGDDGAVWASSAIRTVGDFSGYPEVNALPLDRPEITFLNTYVKEEEPADPVIPEEFDVTITKKIEGIDPADLPDGTMFNFKFDSLDGKQNLGEVKFTKNDLLKGERSKLIGKLPKGFEITENGSSIPGYDVVVDVELKGIKSVEEGDDEGSLGSFEIDTVPFVPDVPTNRTRAVTPYEIIITNTYTPIDPSQQVPSDINMPQTGDESSILLWAGLMLLSGAAGMVLLRRKREA